MEVINVMHNNEYISKLDLVRILQKAYAEGRIKAKDGCMSVLDDINALPAADVQPVKRGKWEEEDTMPYDNFVVCSECGLNLSPQNYTKEEWQESFKYCPCCGARMDGGAKND